MRPFLNVFFGFMDEVECRNTCRQKRNLGKGEDQRNQVTWRRQTVNFDSSRRHLGELPLTYMHCSDPRHTHQLAS